MKVTNEILERLYDDFTEFVSDFDNHPFTSFVYSQYLTEQENYKYSVFDKAQDDLGSKLWKKGDIGTGIIQKHVASAIRARVFHAYKMFDNNLINWRKKDDFVKIGKNKTLETILFNFYKSNISDKQAFESLLDSKLSYQFIAYLFFIKDRNRFMPISQKRFDRVFVLLHLDNFKTSGKASWENYSEFLDIIKQTHKFLQTKIDNPTLLDAHSFLWICGNQMAKGNFVSIRDIQDKSEESDETKLETIEELSFPEGKQKFRLHQSKERSRGLIKAVKEKYYKENKKLCCQVCNFSFADTYGELGEGFIEAHHLFPISELKSETKTKIEDIALVCSNCHRMLHRRRPWLALDELQTIVE